MATVKVTSFAMMRVRSACNSRALNALSHIVPSRKARVASLSSRNMGALATRLEAFHGKRVGPVALPMSQLYLS
eukprot:9478348-Pyramimonas_sp.AAC.1